MQFPDVPQAGRLPTSRAVAAIMLSLISSRRPILVISILFIDSSSLIRKWIQVQKALHGSQRAAGADGRNLHCVVHAGRFISVRHKQLRVVKGRALEAHTFVGEREEKSYEALPPVPVQHQRRHAWGL